MVVVGKGGRIEGGGAGSQNLGFLEGVLHTVVNRSDSDANCEGSNNYHYISSACDFFLKRIKRAPV